MDLLLAEDAGRCGPVRPQLSYLPAFPHPARSASSGRYRSPIDPGKTSPWASPLACRRRRATTISVVIDRLTKARHLVPSRSSVDAAGLAGLFTQHIFRLHGLPNSVVSDRRPRFAEAFWKWLCNRFGIDRRLATAFHPESDGQTERVNPAMEQYIGAHVNYLQDGWPAWLPLAESAANNQSSETTCVSFFGLYGKDPGWQCDLMPPAANDADNLRAHSTAQAFPEAHGHLRTKLCRAQEHHVAQADCGWLPAPRFLPGYRVWLTIKNVVTRRPSPKLDYGRLGPFEAIANSRLRTPCAVRLRLPDFMRIHLVFHVSWLECTANDPFPGQRQPPPPPIEADGEDEYHMDAILDSCTFVHWEKLQYLVEWTGYDRSTWETTSVASTAYRPWIGSMPSTHENWALCRQNYAQIPCAPPELGSSEGGIVTAPALTLTLAQ